jgi:uncharacterized membrane protein
VKRFLFLDWMRGLAVVIMIQCHATNSFVRMDLRNDGPYILAQFVGGMAAPLFLFMAGMTFGFQMESLDRREPARWGRWWISLRRAGYIMGIALLFRLTNWMGSFPNGDPHEIAKVDILNCMAVAMGAFAVAAMVPREWRAQFGVLAALAVALASPVMANMGWDGVPTLLREYLVPMAGRGHFPFFPCASYIGFGLAAGIVVKRVAENGLDRLMQWAALVGMVLIFGTQYFSNLPYSVYPQSNFWTNSPTLILIRTGIILALLAASYLWTGYCVRPGWSWMQTLGKTSLMVYWVHVVLVYGGWAKPIKRTMTMPQAIAATVVLTALMVLLAEGKLRWVARRKEKKMRATGGQLPTCASAVEVKS